MNMATNKASVSTGATVTATDIARKWEAAQRGSADLLWQFSRALLGFVTANPKVKYAEIGEQCAIEAKRATPYSKSWVSKALKAARATPTAPATPAEATAFYDLFNGNKARKGKKTKASPTAEEMIKAGLAFLKRAAAEGAEVEDIEERVHEALTDEADEQDQERQRAAA
jgi:hypothetical protein